MSDLIKKIRALKPTVIISAAPQANGVVTKLDVAFVTTGANRGYDEAINRGGFDYIWLQAYNTGSDSEQIDYKGILYSQTDIEYIVASYFYFTSGNNKYIKIPERTKFLIGEPASKEAAGDATVWHNPKYVSTDIYANMAKQYASLKGQPKFGGAMTWSVNQDIDVGCKFSSAVNKEMSGKGVICRTDGTTYHGTLNPNACQ